MNSTKIVVILLILLMVIFFIGLSLNLFEKPNQGVEKGSKKEQHNVASDYKKNSWLKVVDKMLAPFADAITAKELTLKNCSRTNKGFNLNEQFSSCKIEVKSFSETFKKLSLKPSNRRTKLDITYKPAEGEEDEFNWPSKDQPEDNIDFVILGKEELKGQVAATISLECTNCSNQRQVKIIFE